MSADHNIFISHRHEDEELVAKLKDLLIRHGIEVRDSSVTSSTPNNANSEDYIKSILAAHIQWAGKVIVIVSPGTKDHPWVDWEINYANKQPNKRIIGVWAPGEAGCDLPEPLERHADSLVAWNADAIIRALNGEDNWQAQDGSEAPARTISRIGCP